MNETARTKPPNTRPTIGLLTYGAGEPCNYNLWAGVDDVAREHSANLVCFPGRPLRSPTGFDAQANVLYELVSTENLDGLVIWGGIMAHHVGFEEVRAFFERYRPLPIVSVALPLEGIPSVLVDNYQGIRDVTVHLIEVHGYRRVAFIRGPEGHLEAEERYRAYTDALTEYGLPLDPDLVAPGDFKKPAGATAIKLLLNQRGADFEAVVSANDMMAMGAMETLQEWGMRMPGDIAVVGFDDIEESRFSSPPLTTARQPYYEIGRQAVEMLLAQLQGKEVPEEVIVPSELAVRESCGCLSPAVKEATAGQVMRTGETFEAAIAARRERVLSEMIQAVGAFSAGLDPGWAGQLLDAFSAELEGDSPGTFLSTLNDTLRQAVAVGGDATSWQGALSALRRHALPCLGDDEVLSRAEDLWQQARVAIGETAERAQAYQAVRAEEQAQILSEISQTLSTTFDVAGLVDVLAQDLPGLGIPSCYLSLYENPESPAGHARLILAYDEADAAHPGGRVALEPGGRRFLSRQLVPGGMLLRERRYSVVVEPLYFREDQLGFALFEAGPREEKVCDTLRGQLSSALKGALLFGERKQAQEALEKAYAEVERQVEERTAELQREIAGRERLQQEIIEAQRQTLQELSTPIIPVMDRIIVMPLIGGIDSMRAKDVTRALLAGIREHRAKVVILDITGVPIVDSGVASYLNKTIQAARLKGAQTIVTGVSDAVAETIVDLGLDWSGIETLTDLQTGLRAALATLGLRIG